ncbi:MAG: 3-hydroxybutyryl-CoA dehydrogenase [Clostridia bacterium]|nr:3-hydroxybutyryl-CoA dehydrogenase [Clostridia bacterium]MBQ4341548.1 3-hydroxybutyryl-CoA dehydrogenase [Clostridia bacterium]
MKKIFVVGAGTMGLDIAQVFSTAGYAVTVYDMTDAIIERSAARLEKGLAKRVEKGKLTEEEKARIIGGIVFTTQYDSAKEADLVIEAIIESAEVKKTVFRNLDGICPEGTVFATNTSSISITEIASATNRPDRCIGMHFFNPATVMKLVEVIRGMATSDETFRAVYALAEDIGKTPVEVAEAPGFVVNRILIPMINEAIGLVAEGVASPQDIDTAMKLGANHPMGPLALGDLVGLDVVLAIMDTIFNETKDSKYRAHPLLRKMVRAGRLGRKTGNGFYQY